jgi:hypothetical protein
MRYVLPEGPTTCTAFPPSPSILDPGVPVQYSHVRISRGRASLSSSLDEVAWKQAETIELSRGGWLRVRDMGRWGSSMNKGKQMTPATRYLSIAHAAKVARCIR